MSAPVVAVDPTTTVEEAMALMTDRRIRHAPVVDEGDLAGMISIGDLVRVMSKQQDYKIQYLTEYITAR
jgi:CBS domain-containing protein